MLKQKMSKKIVTHTQLVRYVKKRVANDVVFQGTDDLSVNIIKEYRYDWKPYYMLKVVSVNCAMVQGNVHERHSSVEMVDFDLGAIFKRLMDYGYFPKKGDRYESSYSRNRAEKARNKEYQKEV